MGEVFATISVFFALEGSLVALAIFYRMQYNKRRFEQCNGDVLGIVPVFNESAEDLKNCTDSIRIQGVKVVLVDDHSDIPVAGATIRNEKNEGKTKSQLVASRAGISSDFVLVVDSDTVIDQGSIEKALLQFDESTGAVVGQIKISNKFFGSSVIGCLYWNSFNVWRAISSIFGNVSVCSGAFTIYRTSIFNKYIQEASKRKIKCGEDRFMTYLLLRDGWKTRYAHDAIAHTISPSGWRFIKQQVRWRQSFWRGLFYSWRAYGIKNWFFTVDNITKGVFCVFSMFVFFFLLYSLANNIKLAGIILVFALIHGVLRSVYGLILEGRTFILFPFWSIFSLTVMAPINMYAILTLHLDRWGTR